MIGDPRARARHLAATGDVAGLVDLVEQLARRPRLIDVRPTGYTDPPDFTVSGRLAADYGHPTVKGWQVTAIGPDDAVLVVLTNPGLGQHQVEWWRPSPDRPAPILPDLRPAYGWSTDHHPRS